MSFSPVTCAGCGSTNVDDTQSPCPECGSTRRNRSIHVEPGVAKATGMSVQLVVTRYHTALLNFAKSLIDQNQFGISTVVAHMACEVIIEQVLSKALDGRQVEDLRNLIIPQFIGYNIANDRIRNIYNVLTGDNDIQQKPFWQKFKESANRRNNIMHNRRISTQQEAEESLEATNALVTYLEQKFGL